MVKNLLADAENAIDSGFDPWVGKILWSRKWQPAPVFLPGKYCGPRGLTVAADVCKCVCAVHGP